VKPILRWMLYILLCLCVLSAGYAILTAGSPHSVLRIVVADPAYDVTIALVLSIAAALLGLFSRSFSRPDGLARLLEMNAAHVRELRTAGMKDGEIADSLLEHLGSRGGLLHRYARRRLLRHLSRME
jgi:hypothetical protein